MFIGLANDIDDIFVFEMSGILENVCMSACFIDREHLRVKKYWILLTSIADVGCCPQARTNSVECQWAAARQG